MRNIHDKQHGHEIGYRDSEGEIPWSAVYLNWRVVAAYEKRQFKSEVSLVG